MIFECYADFLYKSSLSWCVLSNLNICFFSLEIPQLALEKEKEFQFYYIFIMNKYISSIYIEIDILHL